MKTMKTRTRIGVAALLLAGGLLGGSTARAESPDDLLIVANNAVDASALSKADAKRLFLGEKDRVGGTDVVIINAKDGPLRDAFRRKVLDMGAAEEEKHWQDAKVRSGATKPKEFSNPLKAVFSLKKAVSYCFRKDFKEGLGKVLLAL